MNGIINFLKPPGMSSNGAVGFFKKTLNMKKIGHAGTLDPGACGVLVVLVGKGTKLSDYFMNKTKEYIGEIRFGERTDTQDSYGEVIETDDKIISIKMLNKTLSKFIGEIIQTPSRFSAIKINGKKAYELARKGEDFFLKSRKITIYELELLNESNENSFLLRVKCSKGTYIRALFEDIGKSLNTCAYMSFLERTKSGRFDIENAVSIDEAIELAEKKEEDKMLLSLDDVLEDYPKIHVMDKDFKRITNGLDAEAENIEYGLEKSEFRVYCKNIFLGIGELKNGKVKLTKYLLGD